MSDDERTCRSLGRKLRESLLALRITAAYDKDTVVDLYLNEVYFGQLAYGVEAAAQTYFGQSVASLDLAQAALLAGLIQSPAAYNPLVAWDAAKARQAVVLDRMVAAAYIDRAQADLAAAEPLHLAAGDGPLEAPHFVAYVRGLLESELGADAVNGGGLRVVTTLDLDLQQAAEAAVAHHVAELRHPRPGRPAHHATDAALVALDPATGDILAMVGSADYWGEAVDGATPWRSFSTDTKVTGVSQAPRLTSSRGSALSSGSGGSTCIHSTSSTAMSASSSACSPRGPRRHQRFVQRCLFAHGR
jgi:membrane peptidoglycan carboxypeptidase